MAGLTRAVVRAVYKLIESSEKSEPLGLLGCFFTEDLHVLSWSFIELQASYVIIIKRAIDNFKTFTSTLQHFQTRNVESDTGLVLNESDASKVFKSFTRL